MAKRATDQSPASSQRRLIILGLVAAGAVRTTAMSDDTLSDHLVGERYLRSGDPGDAWLGEGLHQNQLLRVSPQSSTRPSTRPSARLSTNAPTGKNLSAAADHAVYVGEIEINQFNAPAPSSPDSTKSQRFDTPRPGTRQRLRRKRTLRAKLKRVVDSVFDALVPGAYAASVPLRPKAVSSAQLHVEVLATGAWRAYLTTLQDAVTQRQSQHASQFAGRGDSRTQGIHLEPVGLGCEATDHRYDIALNVIDIDSEGVEFALTAHNRDSGIIVFASFGRLPRGNRNRETPLDWCEAKARVKRRTLFFP